MKTQIDSKNIPDLTGLSLNNAKRILSGLNLKLDKIIYNESSYKRNSVIDQSLKAGQVINDNLSIVLTVSETNPIKYLPLVFQREDNSNNDFLKRYLWIFKHLINSFTDKLDNLHENFNPIINNDDFLEWIASWFSLDKMNFKTSKINIRYLLKEAVSLYSWRGTVYGLSNYLKIITGIMPEIIEDYRPVSEYIIEDNLLIEKKVSNAIINKSNSLYKFTVYFPVLSDYFTVEEIKNINKVIKNEKPVHCEYYLLFKKKNESKKSDDFIIGKSLI